MKFAAVRPYAEPQAAAHKLIEIANSVEAVQDGHIHIEWLNGPFLFDLKATPAEYSAGLKLAIDHGWLQLRQPMPWSTLFTDRKETHWGKRKLKRDP